MAYIKIAAVAGLVLGLAYSHWWAFDIGKSVQLAEHLKQRAVAKEMADEVRTEIAGMGQILAGEVQAGFVGINVINQTVVRNIYNEKEIHRVLTNPDCAWPVSTIRVRNEQRLDPDEDRRAGQRANAGMPEPATPAGEQATPAR